MIKNDSSTQKSRKPREVNMKMGMRFSAVLALTGIACIGGVSKPGIAGVSFGDIAAIPGRLMPLDTAILEPNGKPGHFGGLTFIDTTYLAFDPRFTQDRVGVVSESTDPKDNKLGFSFDHPQTTVTLDVVTTTAGQTLIVQWEMDNGQFGLKVVPAIFPTGHINVGPADTKSRRILQVELNGSQAGAFGVDCIIFTDSPAQCPNVPPPPPGPRPPPR
jgi:hypothetical protein